jgi:hypothetical protein
VTNPYLSKTCGKTGWAATLESILSDRGGSEAPESLSAGPSGQGPITDGVNIDESGLDVEPDDAEGTTGESQR